MTVSSPFKIPRKTPFGIGEAVAEWATGLTQLDKFYAQRPAECNTAQFLRFTLERLGIEYRLLQGTLERVPKSGATVVVANHPLGCVEGVILAELLLTIRPDVQILANQYLKTVPELDKLFIGVDVFEGREAHKANLKALRQAHRHLANEGILLVFPAGEVSRIERKRTKAQIQDKEWSRSVSSLIKKNKAATVPCFIDGQNSRRFYMAGKIHPLLRTLMLGRELLNKRECKIGISIGEPIQYKEIHSLCDSQLINYLRLNTYLLKPANSIKHYSSHSTLGKAYNNAAPIAPQLPVHELLDDLKNLPDEAHLLDSNQFSVYCCHSKRIPALLHEIGRMREENFRLVGEGTGRDLDLDAFDKEYLHLFVWDNDAKCLVGAYRLGIVDYLMQKGGLNALYSRTLFQYKHQFIQKMSKNGKCIEMGRSVIAKDYQRSMSALLLLWKGIGAYIQRNPEYTHLFGPVSISNDYSDKARKLLAETMTMHHYDTDSAHYVKPTNPLKNESSVWNPSMLTALGDLQLLSRVIARIDDGKTLPVLLRQYLALNGKLVSFNVDPAFNNALDGLILVDLRNVPIKTLARYMGLENARGYLTRHKVNQCD